MGDDQAQRLSRVSSVRCMAETLHAELGRNSGDTLQASVPSVAFQTVSELVKDAQQLTPDSPYLEKLAPPEPGSPLSEVLLTLVLIRAGLTCTELPERETWRLAERLSGVGSPALSALAGLGVGLSLPFLVDVGPALSASLVASGSAAVIAREAVAAGQGETREPLGQGDALGDVSNAEAREEVRPGLWRRAFKAVWAATPTIASGAITSGVGSFLGDLLKGLIS